MSIPTWIGWVLIGRSLWGVAIAVREWGEDPGEATVWALLAIVVAVRGSFVVRSSAKRPGSAELHGAAHAEVVVAGQVAAEDQ
jgi:hypothetical protein